MSLAPQKKKASGYVTLTLHSHLPYVVNHGTWPHGLEWLLEAAAETYLPILRVLDRLERDGIALKANVNLSPILLEQLAHPVFQAEFVNYVDRKILAAREDEAFFLQTGEPHFAETARFWQQFYQDALNDFEALGHDIIKGFKRFHESGQIEIITCGATHGYFPLLGTDESIYAQVQTGVATHVKHIGHQPRGIWAPECGYRPAGEWQAPVPSAGARERPAPFYRKGVEEFLGEAGIEFFFVDTRLIEESVGFTPSGLTPYEMMKGDITAGELEKEAQAGHREFYQPYTVDGPRSRQRPVAAFPRDPRTGVQVWSGDTGYPGDSLYLDFHKKRWPGGHRYWQVTHSKIDMAFKTPYYPQQAADRTKSHAEHFVSLIHDALAPGFEDKKPPILTAPFDAELFGHWWFEGPIFLEHLARTMAQPGIAVQLTTCSEYLDQFSTAGFLGLPEGSWGKNSNNEVWLNPDTSWTWTHIYPAECSVRTLATEGKWRDTPMGTRIAKQLCRELLLVESSDWQFLITTQAARDYAEARFITHVDQFHEVESIWREFDTTGALSEEAEAKLTALEKRDSIFADIDPGLWAKRA